MSSAQAIMAIASEAPGLLPWAAGVAGLWLNAAWPPEPEAQEWAVTLGGWV